MLILSGILSQSDGGSFQNISYSDGNTTTSFKNFAVDVCSASPYIYIRPFSFSFSPGGTGPTYCGFPFGSTLLRLIVSIVAFLVLIALFFHSPLSFFGKYIFLTFAFLYFAAFVLDCNSVSTGSLLCSENFLNTGISTAISKLQLTLSCDSNRYITICVIDVVMSIQFFFLSTSWSLCVDKYPQRESSDQKTLSKMAVGEKETKKKETKKKEAKKDKKKARRVDLDDDDLI